MFLYDIITQTSSIDSNIKAEANALLGNLLKAENTFDKSEIMDNIDKFSERYTKELKKL
ncbi:MAG: hypothetical protein MZV64_26775 [Ignavibacteriales bacterium]|nr:hypothetical protein [Ignavibacteriales bacterium]